MAEDKKPKVTRADAESVVEKLQDLHEDLSPGEQRVLESALQVVGARVSEPEGQALLAEFPDASELLDDVAGFAVAYRTTSRDPQPATPVTPTWTTVTVATVAASHPWITCNLQAPG